MAFTQNFNINDNEKQPDPNQPQGQQQSTGGGSSSAIGGVSAQPKGTSSGRFTNLNQYLQANKNFNQGQGLAGKVVSNVGKQAQNVQQGVQQGQQQFQQQAEQNRVQYDPNVVNQAIQNSAEFAGNEQNVNAFQKLRDASYKGPTDLANAQQLQGQAGQIQTYANLSQNEKDRPTLLKQLYKSPSYNAGQQSLDNLLLQSNSQQLQALKQLNPLASNLNQQVNQASQQAQQQAQQYGQEAANTQQQTREALNQSISQFGQQAKDAVQQAIQNRDINFANLKQNLAEGKISQNDLTQLGLTAGQNLYNIDPTQFLSKSTFTPTEQNIINANQYAQINALGKLAGQAAGTDQSAILQQFQGPSQAGQYAQQGQFSLDKDRLMNEINSAKSAYESVLNPTQKAINQAQSALTGNLYVKGGINQNLSNIENYLNKQYGSADAYIASHPVAAASQDLSYLFNSPTSTSTATGGMPVAGNDLVMYRNFLKNQQKSEQSKLDQNQQTLNNLIAKYNPNRTLQVV